VRPDPPAAPRPRRIASRPASDPRRPDLLEAVINLIF